MQYKETKMDLFDAPEDYYLAHCISADFALGKGIAKEFASRFDMRRILREKYNGYIYENGDCILEGRVLNLITKKQCLQKPTYTSMRSALEKMKTVCISNDIKKVAMPLIGCGLDRLSWLHVSNIIVSVFVETDIEILVCKQ